MSRRVGIGELKAKLSEHLRYVRRGGIITVLDRDEPVARITPIDKPRNGSWSGPPPGECLWAGSPFPLG